MPAALMLVAMSAPADGGLTLVAVASLILLAALAFRRRSPRRDR